MGWGLDGWAGWRGVERDGGSPVPGTGLAALNHIRLSLARLAVR